MCVFKKSKLSPAERAALENAVASSVKNESDATDIMDALVEIGEIVAEQDDALVELAELLEEE